MTISRRLLRATWLVGLCLASWLAVMVVLPFVGPGGRNVVIAGDAGSAARAVLAAGGTIVAYRAGRIIAASPDPRFVSALYSAGAPLVLEARLGGGCIGAARVPAKAGAKRAYQLFSNSPSGSQRRFAAKKAAIFG